MQQFSLQFRFPSLKSQKFYSCVSRFRWVISLSILSPKAEFFARRSSGTVPDRCRDVRSAVLRFLHVSLEGIRVRRKAREDHRPMWGQILTSTKIAGAMFMNLMRTTLVDSADQDDPAGPVPPPPSYGPPLGASRATWPNILKNKANIDYCVDQFYHLTTRYPALHQLYLKRPDLLLTI